MNIKSIRRPKNTATLSIVLSITTNCLLKLGKNRTSFKIRRSRNVLKTDKPDPSAAIPCTRWVYISNELRITITPSNTLNPSLIYRKTPYAVTGIEIWLILSTYITICEHNSWNELLKYEINLPFRIISTAKTQLNTRLLISTTFVSSSGWLWNSIPMQNVLVRMQNKIVLWKILWSTKFSKCLRNFPQHLDTESRKFENEVIFFGVTASSYSLPKW